MTVNRTLFVGLQCCDVAAACGRALAGVFVHRCVSRFGWSVSPLRVATSQCVDAGPLGYPSRLSSRGFGGEGGVLPTYARLGGGKSHFTERAIFPASRTR